MSTDTKVDAATWRSTPHVFVKAGWGNRYCRVCLDPRQKKVHRVRHQDSDLIGDAHLTGYRVASKEDVVYAVVGWNEDGGSCSYAARHATYEAALEEARDLMVNGDPAREGRVYDHYEVHERSYYTCVDTNVAVIR